MNAEQKKRMAHELGQWNAAMKSSCSVSDLLAISTRMAALLHELIDASYNAPEPFGYFKAEPFGWVDCSETDEGAIALYTAPPSNNQSEQHLEMVNAPAPSVPVLTVECEPDYWSGGHYHEGTMPHIDPTAVWKLPIGTELYTAPPAPSVPDEQLQAAFDRGLKAGNEQAIAQQIEIHKLHDLLAVQQPEQSDDQVRDAERYRWLRERYWNDSPLCVISKPKSNCLPGSYFPRSSFLDEEIDAAIERDKKGGAA